MMRLLLVAALVAGCADMGASQEDLCETSLEVTPFSDILVGTEVRVTAVIINNLGGVPDIDWRVRFDQQDVPFTGNGTLEIAFTPDQIGTYNVEMTPSGGGTACPNRQASINVVPDIPGDVQVRLHVIPPLGVDVPPTDRVIQLPAGATTYALGTVTLDPGTLTSGSVGGAAYLRFVPNGQPDAVVESYANASGAFSARVQLAPHHVLVVPTDAAFPPQVFADGAPATGETYTLSTGVAITGTVRRPNGTALAGAKVQVFQNDTSGLTVPSTIGTSAGDGTFTLRAFTANGTNARIVVTPPVGSGLPRLEASSPTFNFTNAVSIAYASSLVTRNVSGTTVTRGGALGNAKVTVVGTMPNAGTVMAGAGAVAIGYVRVPMTATAGGALPSTLVPAADLYAVVEPANAPGDAAVVGFDTTSSVPATITTPAMVPFSSSVILDGTMPLAGVRVELVPTGALDMAGVGPTVLYGNEAGTIVGSVASGALYKAYISDPSRRAAPLYYPNVDAAALGSSLQTLYMQPALVISGTLQVQGLTNRIDGAAVQVFCHTDDTLVCDGVERERALGEDASDSQGSFEVAVTRTGVPI